MKVQEENAILHTAAQIMERRAKLKNKKICFTTPSEVSAYCIARHAGLEAEQFDLIMLDNRHQLIETKKMFAGTIDSAAVYPREIVKECLANNAAAVILAHNHPSGVCKPSDTDVRLTRKLIDALGLVDIRVLDHIVTGDGLSTSLAERGLM